MTRRFVSAALAMRRPLYCVQHLAPAFDRVERVTLVPCRQWEEEREVPATGYVVLLWARHDGSLTAHTVLIWKN
jgi:hypothetical protein